MMWDSCRIWEQKNAELPDGVPNHIYNFPEKCGMYHVSFLLHQLINQQWGILQSNIKKIFIGVRQSKMKRLTQARDDKTGGLQVLS